MQRMNNVKRLTIDLRKMVALVGTYIRHTAREPYVVQACLRKMTRTGEKKHIKIFCEGFSLKILEFLEDNRVTLR
jgi:hypothetical protein